MANIWILCLCIIGDTHACHNECSVSNIINCSQNIHLDFKSNHTDWIYDIMQLVFKK